MIEKHFRKSNGEIIELPDGFKIGIDETSNNVYKIDMFDNEGRSVSNHGDNLDEMVIQAIADLQRMVTK
ncbi:MAG: hypothetical protein ACJA2S_004963 [Cyclobacteriaceae bacterium]|jgi:hypothetical protein